MSAIASQISDIPIVCWTVCSSEDQRKHQSSLSLAFVRGIHRSPVDSPHKGPVTRKMFPFDDVIMKWIFVSCVFCRGLIPVDFTLSWPNYIDTEAILLMFEWKNLEELSKSIKWSDKHAMSTTAEKVICVFISAGLFRSSENPLKLSEVSRKCGDSFIVINVSTQQGEICQLAEPFCKFGPFRQQNRVCFNGNIVADLDYYVCTYFV